MKRILAAFSLLALSCTSSRAQNSLPPNQFLTLDHQHVDGLCILYDPAGSNLLSLVAWQRDAGLDLPTNQVIFVAKEECKLTLPPGTPFGDAGAPFWILPQSQNPNLLYLGVNSERVPAGVFTGPLAIQLKRLEGPGYFMVWQAIGPGQYNIRINTRDGIDSNDNFMPLIGAHEHFNWGFSTNGVYCATFQVSGQRIGDVSPISSLESTFLFQISPLPPPTNFPTWAKGYWPPGFNPPTTLTNGNFDGDLFDNLYEYALNLCPTNSETITNAPFFSFVTTNNQTYGALSFTRYKPALDLDYTAQATSSLPGEWATLTDIFGVLLDTNGITERVTIRDTTAATNEQRFFRLKANLK